MLSAFVLKSFSNPLQGPGIGIPQRRERGRIESVSQGQCRTAKLPYSPKNRRIQAPNHLHREEQYGTYDRVLQTSCFNAKTRRLLPSGLFFNVRRASRRKKEQLLRLNFAQTINPSSAAVQNGLSQQLFPPSALACPTFLLAQPYFSQT